jgi:hypothetical protein
MTVALPGLFALLALSGVAQATNYWGHSYQGIDVMASSDAALARTVAHNIHRVDRVARTLIDWDTAARLPPTHVYLLHHPTFVELMYPPKFSNQFQVWAIARAGFSIDQGENYVLLDALDPTTNRYYGAYYGLGGSILAAEGMHYPAWFSIGFERVLASTRISGTQVTLGAVDPWVGKVILTWQLKFIPTRDLLTLKAGDPLLAPDFMTERYAAECWLLVHLITIEGQHKAEFVEYLKRLNEGMEESAAFAASVKLSYDDLDTLLRQAIRHGSVETRSFNLPDEPDTQAPRLLSAAEAEAQIAKLSAVRRAHPDT